MMAVVAESDNAITKKYYNLCPALIEELTDAIAAVKAGYTLSTGIGGIDAEKEDSVIYDIRGRKVKSVTSSGIYFINGQKEYIRK